MHDVKGRRARSGALLLRPPAVAACELANAGSVGDADGGFSSGGVGGDRATRPATGTTTDIPLRAGPWAIEIVIRGQNTARLFISA